MNLKSPLLYLTFPLALAFGLIWFRRKKVHCDSGGKANKKNINITLNKKRADFKHSVSLPIGKSSTGNNNNDSVDFKFGKSAPIDITPNKISPIRNQSCDKQTVDAEVLNKKIQEADLKTLKLIEESSCESPNLPSSPPCRRRFSFTIRSQEPPIVIKASNMADENSPQSSFGDVPVTFSEDGKKSKKSPRPEKTENSIVKSSPKKTEEKKNVELKIEAEDTATTANFQTNEGQPRNSPVSSPSLSLCSNKTAESGDSGKGSSPPHSEGEQLLASYDFEISQNHVSTLVGRNGQIVQFVKEQSGASILVRHHPTSRKHKLCTIEGTQKQVDEALIILRAKLPARINLKRYEFVEETSKEVIVPTSTIDSTLVQLNLIEGINNDVIISTVINGGHLFFQQSLHPSYPSLNGLQNHMDQSYSSFESPLLPNYNENTVCVGLVDGHWYRLQIIEHIPDESVCLAKYLDFGGYCHIHTTDIRQIRTDFMIVPFQAIECLLSDIRPIGDVWSEEATRVILELTQNRTLQAQVAGYTELGIPEVFLYSILSPNHIVFLNQELVARNLAEWTTPTEA